MRMSNKVSLLAILMACAPAGAWAADGIGPFTASAAAQPATGAPTNAISADFTATVVATGTDPLENPSGVITTYGKLSTGVQTEPDQNTYVDLPGLVKGPTKNYYYGHNFLFQGHENSSNLAYLTRINLDVKDPAHRITLMTPVGNDGLNHFGRIDGSTYDPFTKSILATHEGGGTDGGLIEISTTTWPAVVKTHYGSIGRCGLEGVHTDNKGRVYLVEDQGGANASIDINNIAGTKAAKQPNSYVYRFVPTSAANLDAGVLQALQVSIDGTPLVFGGTSAAQVFADVWSTAQLKLHSGASFPTKWVTIHNTATDGTADFDCNAAARASGATPFKRPENGVFKPDGKYRTFFFATTGDTTNVSGSVPGLAARGAWGGIFQLDMDSSVTTGKLKLIVLGDAVHNSFDNVTFGDSQTLLTSEDRGDTLHDQLNTLDSIWAYSLASPLALPLRVVGQGRDASAAGDGVEDNEPTGIYVSNGGSVAPVQYGTVFNLPEARGFFTQQHGDNTTYELHHK